MLSVIKLVIMVNVSLWKGVIDMIFKEDSQMVKSHVILIMAGIITFADVRDIFNLREMVAKALGLEELPVEEAPVKEIV